MLFDGKSAPPATTRVLTPRQWAQIKNLLSLPVRARGDFEKIVSAHFKAIEMRERFKPTSRSQFANDMHR
jgi:hypothetical protein